MFALFEAGLQRNDAESKPHAASLRSLHGANRVAPLRGAYNWEDTNHQPSDILHQYVPHGNDMAHTAKEHEEMEDGVHVFALVERIEEGSRDVSHALGNDPYHSTC